jgi:hypothetical protein
MIARVNRWHLEGATMEPTHSDPLVPEDHDEIKSEELAALEREVDGLKTALGTRTLIGKAIGVIIEREGVNETEAFEMLKRMSQHSNVKLRDVAARLAEEAQPTGKEEPEEASLTEEEEP